MAFAVRGPRLLVVGMAAALSAMAVGVPLIAAPVSVAATKPAGYYTLSFEQSSTAVQAGIVYVGSNDGSLYAVNAVSGKKLWSYYTGVGVYSSPAVSDGVVYVGSDVGKVYAFRR